MQYSTKQLQAVDMILDAEPNAVVAVTGEAGTGKTTTLRLLLDKLVEKELSFAIVAPTGKAAKRIEESTGASSQTIHKLLGYGQPRDLDVDTGQYRDQSQPKYDRNNPLKYDVVIIDEASMVAQEQKRALLDARKKGSIIALFGDIEQLPPVETEPEYKDCISWFKDILDQGNAVKLDQVYRQAEESAILQNARATLRGEPFVETEDFKIVRNANPHSILKQFIERYPDFKEPHSQIIVPRQTDALGARAASFVIQKQIWGEEKIKTQGIPLLRHRWDSREPLKILAGDKVIFTKNYYASANSGFEVFNGETGVVVKILNNEEGRFSVDLGDRIVVVPHEIKTEPNKNGRQWVNHPEKDVHLAYALTTHKTQGSEYKAIAYVMSQATQYMQSKANKYTAITRAREKVFILSDAESLGEATECSIF